MSMGSELSDTFSPTPKLSLFSLPDHTPDPPTETVTPPFQTPASVPFKWEEAPGKPHRSFAGDRALGEAPAKPKVARCLELPPGKITNTPSPSSSLDGPGVSFRKMLKGEGNIMSTPSPSSVLDGLGSGPKVSKTMSFSFRKLIKGEGKIANMPSLSSVVDGPESGPGLNISKTMSFSFRRMLKGEGKMTNTPSPSSVLDGPQSGPSLGPDPDVSFSFRGPEEGLVWKLIGKEKVNFSSLRWGNDKGFEEEAEGNFDLSSPCECPKENGSGVRKRSGFWANIYKNVKQVVPWKRRQDKRRKTTM